MPKIADLPTKEQVTLDLARIANDLHWVIRRLNSLPKNDAHELALLTTRTVLEPFAQKLVSLVGDAAPAKADVPNIIENPEFIVPPAASRPAPPRPSPVSLEKPKNDWSGFDSAVQKAKAQPTAEKLKKVKAAKKRVVDEEEDEDHDDVITDVAPERFLKRRKIPFDFQRWVWGVTALFLS